MIKKITTPLVVILCFFLIDYFASNVITEGLKRYYGINQNAQIVINGSSMSLAGFDKTQFENIATTKSKVALYARNGVSLSDRYAMMQQYFSQNPNSTQYAVLEVNPLLLSNRFTAANVYMLFLPFMDDVAIDRMVRQNTDWREYVIRKYIRLSRFDLDFISMSVKGYLGYFDNKKTQRIQPNQLISLTKQAGTVPVEIQSQKVKLFKDYVELCTKHCKKVFLVNMPIYSLKKQTFKTDQYEKYMYTIQSLIKNDKVVFVNLSTPVFENNPSYFSDVLHLNNEGQQQLTRYFISTYFISKK